eukprot:COSAG06_NODE_7319_length_2547_cov_3.460317_2_plen_70_part_00
MFAFIYKWRKKTVLSPVARQVGSMYASMPMRAESANDGPSSEQQKKKIEPIVRQAAGQMAVDEEVSIDL